MKYQSIILFMQYLQFLNEYCRNGISQQLKRYLERLENLRLYATVSTVWKHKANEMFKAGLQGSKITKDQYNAIKGEITLFFKRFDKKG